jgi:hypothetical protein
MTVSSYPPPPARSPMPGSMPPIPRVSRGRVMRRGFRRFFKGVGAGVRVIFSGRPILVGCLVLLLPLTGWLAYDRMFVSSSSASSGGQTIVRLPEAPVVQSYIAAVQKGDADAAWNTLSPTEKARRVANNEGKSVLMQIFQLEQQSKMTQQSTTPAVTTQQRAAIYSTSTSAMSAAARRPASCRCSFPSTRMGRSPKSRIPSTIRRAPS